MAKKKKHPDAPKNAMGAYMWFCQDERNRVKEDMPDLSAKEILSELGKRWKTLSENDKVQFNDLANEDKQRFEREKEIFLRTHVSLYEETASPKKKKKDPNAPKKPRTSYILFVNDFRPQVVAEMQGREDVKQTEIMAKVAEKWREADAQTKERYAKLAQQEKEAYQVRLANYKASLDAGGDMGVDGDDGGDYGEMSDSDLLEED